MIEPNWASVGGVAGSVAVAAGAAWALGHDSVHLLGLPVIAWGIASAFAVQWLVFVPAFLLRSERFYDVTGGLTYIAVASLSLALSRQVDGRSLLVLGLVVAWALRLSAFLLQRVHATGKDARFDDIKRSFARFLMAWTIQGLWASLTLAAALTVMTTTTRRPLGVWAWIGLCIWGVGFAIEVAADEQKRRFRADASAREIFISRGLWRWSRHPNYFGEIVLWIGIAVIAMPILSGWQWISLVSPVFVAVLLTRISGIPILEKRADKKWGGRADYEAYKQATSVLIPRPPRRIS